jgi:hypothetical protein
MKKTVVLLSLLVVGVYAYSQTKTIYDTAAVKMCEYMNENTADRKFNSKKEVELFFSEAFLQTCMPFVDRFLEVEGLQKFDNESGRQIGMKVGMKMATNCPAYIKLIGKMMEDKIIETPEIIDNIQELVKGKVTEVISDGYQFLKIKDQNGNIKRVLWLFNFEGAATYNNDPKKLIGKTVSVSCNQVEIFFAKSNSFGKEKMIVKIKVQ